MVKDMIFERWGLCFSSTKVLRSDTRPTQRPEAHRDNNAPDPRKSSGATFAPGVAVGLPLHGVRVFRQ